jgi:polar amino acid transport system permease protein
LFTESVIERLIDGLWITVQLVAMAGALGTAAAILSGLAGLSPSRSVRWANQVYVDFFRGSSAIIQLYWAFYALPIIDRDLLTFSPMQVGVVVLGLNMGGYGSEIVRGAVRAVPRGQYEASTALSIAGYQRMRYIVFPQAVLAMLPPYGNLLIEMMKGTALVSLITLSDITRVGLDLRQAGDLSSASTFTTLLVIYFCLAIGITFIVRRAERFARRSMGLEA